MAALELEHVWGYTPSPHSFAFTTNESTILYPCGPLLIEHNMDDPRRQKIHFEGPRAARIACVDAVGEDVATGDDGGALTLWKYDASGSLNAALRIHSGHRGGILCVKWSPDLRLIATTGAADGALSAFDVVSGERVALYSDPLNATSGLHDVASAVCWGDLEGQSIRNRSYTLYVPFRTGARILKMSFDVATLKFSVETTPCQVPGRGGRTGGFMRHYTSVALSAKSMLCGATNGEVVVFRRDAGYYRCSLAVCAGGVTSLVPLVSQNRFIAAGGDGRVACHGGGGFMDGIDAGGRGVPCFV